MTLMTVMMTEFVCKYCVMLYTVLDCNPLNVDLSIVSLYGKTRILNNQTKYYLPYVPDY